MNKFLLISRTAVLKELLGQLLLLLIITFSEHISQFFIEPDIYILIKLLNLAFMPLVLEDCTDCKYKVN